MIQEIQWIFYNNYTWSIIFKNCESLYCIPVLHIILYFNYTSIKKQLQWVILWRRDQQYPRIFRRAGLVNQLSMLDPEGWQLRAKRKCSDILCSLTQRSVFGIVSSDPLQVSRQTPGDHVSEVVSRGFCFCGWGEVRCLSCWTTHHAAFALWPCQHHLRLCL